MAYTLPRNRYLNLRVETTNGGPPVIINRQNGTYPYTTAAQISGYKDMNAYLAANPGMVEILNFDKNSLIIQLDQLSRDKYMDVQNAQLARVFNQTNASKIALVYYNPNLIIVENTMGNQSQVDTQSETDVTGVDDNIPPLLNFTTNRLFRIANDYLIAKYPNLTNAVAL